MPKRSGRPINETIENNFMEKIRENKLQAIYAECELDKSLILKQEEKLKKENNNYQGMEEESEALRSRIKLLMIGNSDDFKVDERRNLEAKFRELKEAWKLEEIKESDPLPDYFFDDGCDLSYIIYELQKDQNNSNILSPEELIFLEILCLDERKQLSDTILEYFENNMKFMIEEMKNGLKTIQTKLLGLKTQKKTKSIAKGKKNKKNEEIDASDESSDNHDDKELALKTINYITWAYWYVIPKL